MESFVYSLNATVPVFLVMILGNVLHRIGLLPCSFSNAADKLVFKICLPCMLYLELADTDIRKNFDGMYIGYCFFVTLFSILLIWGFAKIFLKEKTSVGAFVQGAYRSSAAILGSVFISNIYGTSKMAPIMILGSVPLYNIFAVLILTLESKEAVSRKTDTTDRKERRRELRRTLVTSGVGIIKNPIIIGIFLGILSSYFKIFLPAMFEKAVSNLGSAASPLALLSIGASFEGKKAIAKIKPTLAAGFLKLVGLAAVSLPIAVFLGFREEKLVALIIMLASPCTPTAYIMEKNMDGDEVLASSIIVVTTFLSSVTLTGWFFLVRFFHLV